MKPYKSQKARLQEIVMNLMIGGMNREQATAHAKIVIEQECAAMLGAAPVKV
jgi:hypothetical protein